MEVEKVVADVVRYGVPVTTSVGAAALWGSRGKPWYAVMGAAGVGWITGYLAQGIVRRAIDAARGIEPMPETPALPAAPEGSLPAPEGETPEVGGVAADGQTSGLTTPIDTMEAQSGQVIDLPTKPRGGSPSMDASAFGSE